jgi:hypothetical protein
MRPDPIPGRITLPQSLNRYAYVRNNPTNLVDPLGLDAIVCDGFVILEPPDGDPVKVFTGCRLVRGSTPNPGFPNPANPNPNVQQIVVKKVGDKQKKEFRDYLKNLDQKCKDKLEKLDKKILKKLANAIGDVNIIDADSIADIKAFNIFRDTVIEIAAKAPLPDKHKYLNMTVGEYFTKDFVPESLGGTPAIAVSPKDKSVGPIPGIFAKGGLSNPGFAADIFNPVMVQELLHYELGKTDDQLKQELGTKGKDVSVWLAEKCPE